MDRQDATQRESHCCGAVETRNNEHVYWSYLKQIQHPDKAKLCLFVRKRVQPGINVNRWMEFLFSFTTPVLSRACSTKGF